MEFNIPNNILREIRFFAREYGIDKIILFGSRARGTHAERSDIDIAVSGGDFDAFSLSVKEKTHTLLSIDIIDYDKSAKTDLKMEIEKDGILIYEKT